MAKPRVRRTRLDSRLLQDAFIAAFRESLSIRTAAESCKITPRVHHNWMRATDGRYRAEFEQAFGEAGDALEDEAVRRAYQGVKRQLYYRGKPVKIGRGRAARTAYETEYSDTLLLALLKRFKPNEYRERTQTEVTGAVEIVDRLQAARKRLVEMRANVEPDSVAG